MSGAPRFPHRARCVKMGTRFLGTMAAAALLTGCDRLSTSLEADPDLVPRSEILQLLRAGGTVPLLANGTATDTLIALLPRDANPRTVTFATTAGSFPLAGGGRGLAVRAEYEPAYRSDRLVARAVLQSDSIPGTAIVSAEVGEFKEYAEVVFIHP